MFITALAMMFSLLGPEVAKLATWPDALTPPFIAVVMTHFAAVVLAFVGGKQIPTERDPTQRTRSADTTTPGTTTTTTVVSKEDQQ